MTRDNSPSQQTQLHYDEIEWLENGVPFSRKFGDIYHPAIDPLETARHTFLKNNRLPARWGNRDTFAIGELGFGLGLNFLLTLSLWQQSHGANKAELHYFSVEKYTLSHSQMERGLANWDELEPARSLLLKSYGPNEAQDQVIDFPGLPAKLTILFGDAMAAVQRITKPIDTWFLDGFDPKKNHEMWSAELFQSLTKLSAPEASAATWSASGTVRRNLQSAGFLVERIPGFGCKRENVRATLKPNPAPAPDLG